MTLLETLDLTRAYGGVVAVNKVNFSVEEGLITGLIGPNGAGKTTLFNNITGLDVPTHGRVIFAGRDITGSPAHKICRMGIARTFQNIRLFKDLTVVENVMIGRHFKTGKSETKGRFLNAFNSYIRLHQEEEEIYERACEWLEFFDMEGMKDELAKNLPDRKSVV